MKMSVTMILKTAFNAECAEKHRENTECYGTATIPSRGASLSFLCALCASAISALKEGSITFSRIILLATLAVFSSATAADEAAVKSMRGDEVSATDKAPDSKAYSGKKPGLQKPIPRTFKGQPPLIPHAVDNFDDITLEENQCLSCHGLEKYKEKHAPKIGDSHVVLKEVSKARYQCTTCHVPQVDAKPLAINTFVGDTAEVDKWAKGNGYQCTVCHEDFNEEVSPVADASHVSGVTQQTH